MSCEGKQCCEAREGEGQGVVAAPSGLGATQPPPPQTSAGVSEHPTVGPLGLDGGPGGPLLSCAATSAPANMEPSRRAAGDGEVMWTGLPPTAINQRCVEAVARAGELRRPGGVAFEEEFPAFPGEGNFQEVPVTHNAAVKPK